MKTRAVASETQAIRRRGRWRSSPARGGETVAILVGLTDIKRTARLLYRYWPPEAKVAIVYRVGYRDTQKVVHTRLGDLERTVGKHGERHLGIIYIGKHL